MDHPLPLTGERTLPGIPAENYWFQRHVAAYRFAAGLVRGLVLDAGSGEGYGADLLAGRSRVLGLEYDQAAAAHAAQAYPSIRVAAADVCRLPVADESVDAVVAMQLLEHLFCADRFVATCRRILRPGGVLIAATPNRPTFSPGGTLNPFHVYEYDADELRALLRVHFEDVRLYGLAPGWRLRMAERLTGGSLQTELMQRPFEALSASRRRLVARIDPGHFRISTRRIQSCLDLVAVCRA